MQTSQSAVRLLLTALEVQELLHIDRSTVYRMAEDGRLPALRVGRSWRFPADKIRALATTGQADGPTVPNARTHDLPSLSLQEGPDPRAGRSDALDTAAARAAVEVAADLLGVMMVVTDMTGQPLTEVTNPSPWYAAHAGEPGVLDQCVTEWRDLADHPDLTPEFRTGALGFQCARAFIRDGSTLVGMVLAGGVSPAPDPDVDPDLYHLDEAARQRVLAALPRIAVAIARSTPAHSTPAHATPTGRSADTPVPNPPAPATTATRATTKENR